MAYANDDDKAHYNEYSDIAYSYALRNKDKDEHDGTAEDIEMSGAYEALNTKQGDQYEEIVQTSLQTPISNGVHPLVHSRLRDQMTVSTISDTSMRHRFNPLYDAAISRQSINTTSQEDNSKETQILAYVRCLGILCLLFFAVAAASLAVTIYVLVTPAKNVKDGAGVTSPQTGESKDNLSKNLTNLQRAILSLRTRIDLVNTNTSLDIYMIQTQFSDFTKQVNSSLNSIKTDWANYSKSLDIQLVNISKLPGPRGSPGPPGPQGDPGLVDYSNCSYSNVERTLKLPVLAPHSTDWAPDDTITKNYAVVGAACSVEGGETHNLETKRQTGIQNQRQYRCTCGGRIHSVDRRKCILHLWMCPRNA